MGSMVQTNDASHLGTNLNSPTSPNYRINRLGSDSTHLRAFWIVLVRLYSAIMAHGRAGLASTFVLQPVQSFPAGHLITPSGKMPEKVGSTDDLPCAG